MPLLQSRIQLVPHHIEPPYNLCMVYRDQQQFTEALELLGRALELDSGLANA